MKISNLILQIASFERQHSRICDDKNQNICPPDKPLLTEFVPRGAVMYAHDCK
jgi:hypothetical protein